jgi:hypothetical protein
MVEGDALSHQRSETPEQEGVHESSTASRRACQKRDNFASFEV